VANPKPTVYIVDDDSSARRGLARLIRASGMVAETFPSAEAFLTHDRHHGPACIVLDVRMPGSSGPALQEQLAEAAEGLPIVFLSAHGDVPTTARAMKKGAVDFLTKPVDREQLLGAVHTALRQAEEALETRAELAAIQGRLDTLTPREREIMTYVIGGLLNKQIAFELGIAEDTVKIHRKRVMTKMKAGSVAELVRLTEKAGVEPASGSDQ
jgi:FixJ family two-component response regulator